MYKRLSVFEALIYSEYTRSKIMITKDTIISDIPQLNPAALDVLWNYGMGCIHCVLANSETIEQAAAEHGLDVDQLIKDLNEAKAAE